MSTSPLPPDPYEALGVTKECDLDEIKKAHRKLVLKHHPDRIKDPALQKQGEIEFHKVQQAYELLIDPVRRDRYNDQCRLAQLRKERMMDQAREMPRDSPARSSYSRSTYPTQPPNPSHAYNGPPPRRAPMPQSTPQPMYEERAPNDSYFDIPKYDEPLPTAHTRKADSFDRRTSAAKPTEKPSPKPKAGWDRASSGKGPGSTFNLAFGLKQKATEAKKKVAADKEAHARAAKARDVEERRARDQKEAYGRYSSRVEDDASSESSDSSTDDDEPVVKGRRNVNAGRERSPMARNIARERSPARNVTRERSPVRRATRERSPASTAKPVTRERSPSATLRPSARERSPIPKSQSQSHLTPEHAKARQPSPRPERRTAYVEEEHESPDDSKWEHHHRASTEYIAASRKTRPPVSRQNSDIDQYWTGSNLTSNLRDRDHKRSGSDSDRQRERPPPVHKSSSHRRSTPQEYPDARPSLSTHASAPANVRGMVPEATTRSRQNSYDPRDARSHRREMAENLPPSLNRTGSAPMPRSDSKRDNAPMKSSTLKTETNFDSGYGSGSAPHTPETGGESPPTERERDREPARDARPAPKRGESKTIYRAARDPTGQDSHRAQKVNQPPPVVEESHGPPLQKFLSPEDIGVRSGEERRERRGSRTREDESRTRSNRPSERRPSISRVESSSRYEERPSRSKHSSGRERSPERVASRGSFPVDSNNVKYSTQRAAPPRFASYHEALPSRAHHGGGSHRHHSESKRPTMNFFGQLVG